jgi:hypothetical protein
MGRDTLMKMTRVRDVVASVFVLLLVLAMIAAVMWVMGKPVPIIGGMLGQ